MGALLFAGVALAKPLAESDPHADPYYYSGMPVDLSGDFSFRQQLTNLYLNRLKEGWQHSWLLLKTVIGEKSYE